MPRTNWDEIDEQQGGYQPTPAGSYFCSLVEAKEKTSKDGWEQWKLTWEVADGPYKGRKFRDWLTWNFESKGAMAKLKLACRGLGVDVRGEREVALDDLANTAIVTVEEPEPYEGDDGKTYHRNNVAFDGYRPATEEAVSEALEAARAASNDSSPDPDRQLPF